MADDIVALARRAAEAAGPEESLQAIVDLRRRLSALEARQVDAALEAGWSWSRIAAELDISKQAAHRKHSRRRAAARVPAAALPPPPSDREATEGERRRLTITGEARRAVEYAREEAGRLGAPAVAPEHLLLGLLRGRESAAARALEAAGVTLEPARASVRELARGEAESAGSPGRRPPILPEARAVFEQSLREAVARRDAHLGVEHILIALVRLESPGVRQALSRLGMSVGVVGARLGEQGAGGGKG